MKKIYLIRHGETEWSKSGRHTSYSDLELTKEGSNECLLLKQTLPKFDQVFISPLKRAQLTSKILNLHGSTLKELTEWNYGIYEGKTTEEIRQSVKDWNIFTHGALFGETLEEVEARAKKVLSLIKNLEGAICLVSSGHFIRVLIAVYLNQPCSFGKHLVISTGSMTILSHDKGYSTIELLNQKA